MSYSFVNRPYVNKDIEEILNYYTSINSTLASQFLNRIEEVKKYIVKHPLAFQVKYKNVRTVLLKQFPYHLHYIIDDTKKQIVVLAIVHAYKSPKNYAKRK